MKINFIITAVGPNELNKAVKSAESIRKYDIDDISAIYLAYTPLDSEVEVESHRDDFDNIFIINRKYNLFKCRSSVISKLCGSDNYVCFIDCGDELVLDKSELREIDKEKPMISTMNLLEIKSTNSVRKIDFSRDFTDCKSTEVYLAGRIIKLEAWTEILKLVPSDIDFFLCEDQVYLAYFHYLLSITNSLSVKMLSKCTYKYIRDSDTHLNPDSIEIFNKALVSICMQESTPSHIKDRLINIRKSYEFIKVIIEYNSVSEIKITYLDVMDSNDYIDMQVHDISRIRDLIGVTDEKVIKSIVDDYIEKVITGYARFRKAQIVFRGDHNESKINK